jgi:hypothetical protein
VGDKLEKSFWEELEGNEQLGTYECRFELNNN